MLKVTDDVVYRSAPALEFEPVLYPYCEMNGDLPRRWAHQFSLDLDCSLKDAFDILRILRSGGGLVVYHSDEARST